MQQQKTASASESIEVSDPHHEPSMSSLSVVLCTRFEKNDLFGNMSALYIVMEHTSEKRHRAHRHLFSPRERAYFTTPIRPVRFAYTRRIFIFITTSCAPESTDFLSPHRCESILTRSRLWRFRKLINLQNLSYFLHSLPLFHDFHVGGTYILTNFMSRLDSIFTFHKIYSVLCV